MSPVLNPGSSVGVDVGAVKWCSGSTESRRTRGEEISGKMPAGPIGKMPVLRLPAGFFDELASGFDPVVVGIAGALPCWMTAARAAGTDPMIALRTE